VARLLAWWLLGSSLIVTLLRWAVGAGRRGEARFRAQYAGDLPAPGDAADRAAFDALGTCIACGLCDRAAPLEGAGLASGLTSVVLVASRSVRDLVASADELAGYDASSLAAREQECPTRFPLRRLAALARRFAGSDAAPPT
jgi:hypothetical protein